MTIYSSTNLHKLQCVPKHLMYTNLCEAEPALLTFTRIEERAVIRIEILRDFCYDGYNDASMQQRR